MSHTVISTRKVPVSETVNGCLLGKKKTYNLGNGGKVGICVRLDDGRMAWGFGSIESAAEEEAVKAAMAI